MPTTGKCTAFFSCVLVVQSAMLSDDCNFTNTIYIDYQINSISHNMNFVQMKNIKRQQSAYQRKIYEDHT
jgi:hypothetical protein